MAYQDFGINDKQDTAVRVAYRELFSTEQGQAVLTHMLTELGYFDTVVEGERAMGRQDYARRLLWIMGLHDSRNLHQFVQNILKLPLHKEGTDMGS